MKKDLTTLFTGRDFTRLPVTGSTNSYLAELARERLLSEGSLVVAGEQIAGRGQGGTSWVSEKDKNLLASFLFYPNFLSPNELFKLSKFFSLGIASAIEKLTGEIIYIKWPNDIYFKYKKLGGILIENTMSGGNIASSICGIGLNVNQDRFPEHLPNPVSLKQITGHSFDLDEVKNVVCNEVESKYLLLKTGQQNQIADLYLRKLYLFNKWSLYTDKDGQFTGRIIGVELSGRLVIEREDGKINSYDLKEVKFK